MTRTVLVAGHWDDGPGYPRTELLLGALARCGCHVEECRVPAPARGTTKVGLVKRPWRWPGYWLASRGTRARLVRELRRRIAEGGVDAVLVPYPGHIAVRWVRSVWRGPLLLDLFLSAHSTAVEDRALFSPGSVPARLLAHLDRRACEAADVVLLDTQEHAELVATTTGLPRTRFDWVPIGDVGPSAVAPVVPPAPGEPLRLLFFGTGVPLHGLPTWLAAIARVEGVTLELYGGDEDSRAQARSLLGARAIIGPRFAPMGELREAIDRAHLVLGIAGTSEKARRVVPFKVAHALAHGRPLLTADTPAIRRQLVPERDCLLANAGDVESFAQALRAVVAAPQRLVSLGAAARLAWQRAFSPAAIEARLAAVIDARLGALPGATPGLPSPADRPRGPRLVVSSS
ncbi:MAG: glycosyltransferase family 4 protein [Planctomycetes bacterium]|nr:glycosyltransferase family 4 protein [Planctomycetota bacterium]